MKKRHFLLFLVVVLVLLFSQPVMQGKGGTVQSGHNFSQAFIQPKSGTCFKPDNPIHVGIQRMGQIYQSGRYNDDVMYSVISAYWDPGAWDLNQSWRHSSLDGYLVYVIVRVALMHQHQLINYHPDTRNLLELLLDDYVTLDLGTIPDSRFHKPPNVWNSRSEDYMGFALGFASYDAWYKTWDKQDEVITLVESAFTDSTTPSLRGTLIRGEDPDPEVTGEQVMLRNHSALSPVYAMLVIKHIHDINLIYEIAGYDNQFNRHFFYSGNIPENVDDLYDWVVAKIEPNQGAPVFRAGACEHADGSMIDCDDWQSCQREPGHYPMQFLSEFNITNNLGYFGDSCCGWVGPAGITQGIHNYYFNCVFTCMYYQPAPEPEMEILYHNQLGPASYTVSDDQLTHQVDFIFYTDSTHGRYEERPEGGCRHPHIDNPYFVNLRVIQPYDDNGDPIPITGCEFQDAWDDDFCDCPPIALDQWIPNSTFIFLNTDPFQPDSYLPNCDWDQDADRYKVGTIGFFQVRLEDDLGNIFFRRINLKRVSHRVQEEPPQSDW